ncbi:hypothetical protein CsSME_00053074 [Camellia sinensis var. sinensis]
MGTVRGTYTKHLHCEVRTTGGVRIGRVPMGKETDKHGGSSGSMSCIDSLGM